MISQSFHHVWELINTLTHASSTIQMMADQEIFSCASNSSFRVLFDNVCNKYHVESNETDDAVSNWNWNDPHTALESSCKIPWMGLAWTEDGRPAGGMVIAAVTGATFLVFSFSFSSFVTDLNTQSFVTGFFPRTVAIRHEAEDTSRGRNKRQLRQNPCERCEFIPCTTTFDSFLFFSLFFDLSCANICARVWMEMFVVFFSFFSFSK